MGQIVTDHVVSVTRFPTFLSMMQGQSTGAVKRAGCLRAAYDDAEQSSKVRASVAFKEGEKLRIIDDGTYENPLMRCAEKRCARISRNRA